MGPIGGKQSNWALGYLNGKYDSFYFNGLIRQGLNASDTQVHVHAASVNDSDETNAWVDFQSLVQNSSASHDSAYKPGKLSLGGYGGLERSNGEVAEILYFNRILNTEERIQIEGYLAHKWGLSSLPFPIRINHWFPPSKTLISPWFVHTMHLTAVSMISPKWIPSRKFPGNSSGASMRVDRALGKSRLF